MERHVDDFIENERASALEDTPKTNSNNESKDTAEYANSQESNGNINNQTNGDAKSKDEKVWALFYSLAVSNLHWLTLSTNFVTNESTNIYITLFD